MTFAIMLVQLDVVLAAKQVGVRALPFPLSPHRVGLGHPHTPPLHYGPYW